MANDYAIVDQDTKTEIKAEELPAAVKSAHTEGDYAEWNVVKTYKVADAKTGGENYEVQVENADGKKMNLTYNAAGELISAEEDY